MMVVGLRTYELMEEIVQHGEADFFSLCRLLISEPGIINDTGVHRSRFSSMARDESARLERAGRVHRRKIVIDAVGQPRRQSSFAATPLICTSPLTFPLKPGNNFQGVYLSAV